jgi:hypothetical protein
VGISWAYLANVALIVVPLNYGVVLRRLRLPFMRLLSLLWRPAVATVVMYGISRRVAHSADASVGALAMTIALGAATYGATLAALWLLAGLPKGPEKTFTDEFIVPTWGRIAALRQARS